MFLSLEVTGTSVTFPCSGDYFLIDSHCRYRNLQEFHGWKFKIDMELSGCTQIGESRSRTKSSVNMLAGFSPSQIAPMQEGVATSSTDVAEQVSDTTEASKTSKESVSVEQSNN